MQQDTQYTMPTPATQRPDTRPTLAAGNGAMSVPPVLPGNRKKKRRARAYLSIGISLLVLIVVIAVAANKKEKPITVQTEKASRRTITEVVQATGKIQPEVQVKVSPEVSGEIIELPFKEGAHVKKGDLIAKIKPTTFQAAVEQAEASLSATKATAEQQHASLINAEQELTRAESLVKQHLMSQSDFEGAKAKRDAALAAYNSSKYQIDASESQLRQYRESLNKTSVQAPMTGVITSLISQLGEKVVGTSQFAGTEMMAVSDLTVMNAMVDVDENDVVNIKLGNKVKVSIDAFPNQVFTGTVIEIANSASLAGTGTQDQSTNFTVKVRLDDFGTADLRPGMSCTARIETQTKQNVLAVPLMAVTRRESDESKTQDSVKLAQQANKGSFHEGDETPTIVFVVEKGKAKEVPVKVGISDNAYVEILSGVTEGQEIVKGNFRAVSKDLENGSAVKVDNSGKALLDEKSSS